MLYTLSALTSTERRIAIIPCLICNIPCLWGYHEANPENEGILPANWSHWRKGWRSQYDPGTTGSARKDSRRCPMEQAGGADATRRRGESEMSRTWSRQTSKPFGPLRFVMFWAVGPLFAAWLTLKLMDLAELLYSLQF